MKIGVEIPMIRYKEEIFKIIKSSCIQAEKSYNILELIKYLLAGR